MSSLVSLLSSYKSDSDSEPGDDGQHPDTATGVYEDSAVNYEYRALKSDLAIAINPTPLVEISVSKNLRALLSDPICQFWYI
jgi:hypothetical protein